MKKVGFEKLCVFGVILLFHTMSYAEERCLYRFGLGLGFEYTNLEAKIKEDFSPFGFNQFGTRKQTHKAFRVSPAVEIGIFPVSNFYAGLLASWSHRGAHTKARDPLKNLAFFIHRFKLNSSANILAKLGYQVSSKTMLYGLIGPSISKWSHKSEIFDREDQRSAPFKTETLNVSKISVGLGLGFGAEYFAFDKVALSIDFMHAFYKATTGRQMGSFTEFIRGKEVLRRGIVSQKIKPSYDQITIRFTYFLY